MTGEGMVLQYSHALCEKTGKLQIAPACAT